MTAKLQTVANSSSHWMEQANLGGTRYNIFSKDTNRIVASARRGAVSGWAFDLGAGQLYAYPTLREGFNYFFSND